MLSRQVANQIGNKLQIIVTLIELNHREKAIRAVQELARFLNRHVETEENESNS
jgi:ribosomal protein L31E